MKTKLSILQIQLALRNSFLFNQRSDIIVPNVSWSMLNYEADLLAINKTGQLTEVEIKRSMSDLRDDFRKGHQHDAATYFYYCVPENIIEQAKAAILENMQRSVPGCLERDCPALLCYTEGGTIKRSKFGTPRRFGYRPVGVETRATLGRMASLRYWNLVQRVALPEDFSGAAKIRALQGEIRDLLRILQEQEESKKDLHNFLRHRHPEILNEYYDQQ